jgi:hypothetical protein
VATEETAKMERAAPQSAFLEALRSPFEFQGRQRGLPADEVIELLRRG